MERDPSFLQGTPARRFVARLMAWEPPRWFAVLTMLGSYAILPYLIYVVYRDNGVWGLTSYGAFFVALIVLGLLAANFRPVEKAVSTVFGTAMVFCLWVIVTLVPITLFLALSRYIVTEIAPVLQVALFAIWGLLMIVVLALIATEANRKWLFARLRLAGGFAPLAYSLNVLTIAIIFFASLAQVMSAQGILDIVADGRPMTTDRFLEFFLWHFLEEVPALKVNQTLRWDEPWSYKSGSMGWMLLAFKLTVIIPVIGAFVGYWKQRNEAATK